MFEVLPPLAAAVALAATAAEVTLGGLVWSPAETEEFLEAKYKRVGGAQCSENIMRNNNIKSNKRAKASQGEASREVKESLPILASLIFLYNICLRLRVACHGVKELARRLRFATTQVEVDSAYPKSNVSNCQHDIRADPHPVPGCLDCHCDWDGDWDCDCDSYPAPVPRSAAGGEQRASAH